MMSGDGRVRCLKQSGWKSCGHCNVMVWGCLGGCLRLGRGPTLWGRGNKEGNSQVLRGSLLCVLKRGDHGHPGTKTTKECMGRSSLEIVVKSRGNG